MFHQKRERKASFNIDLYITCQQILFISCANFKLKAVKGPNMNKWYTIFPFFFHILMKRMFGDLHNTSRINDNWISLTQMHKLEANNTTMNNQEEGKCWLLSEEINI